jgi:hypothetical protein
MFKVSFKETPKNPVKLVTKMGNETTILMKGTVGLPAFWKYMPDEICEWVFHQTHIEIYEDISKNQLIIYSKGIAKCHPGDRYDTILGERMAESRAKYNIYKFFYELTYRLSEYYGAILYGNDGPIVDTPKDGLMADVQKYEKLYQKERAHQIELLKGNKHE